MRDQVGRKIQFTPGEVQRYFEEHKQDYAQPESVRLSEILVATSPSDDEAKQAAAKAKAADIEAKLHQGGDFSQLAKSFSDGSTAAEGGDLGQFKRGTLAPVLETQTFALKTGQYTDPILTKQGLVIFKVTQHNPGGVPEFKDVEQDVEQNFYETRMMPAIREYLTQMREEAAIDIKPGYTDTGASRKETKLTYSAYTPPVAKKKKKVERTRFRETTRSFRQKSTQAAAPADATTATKKNASLTTQKPGKKEKIRFGQAPSKTLPNAAGTKVEDREPHRHHRWSDGHDDPHLRDDGSGHSRRALQGLEEGPEEQRRPVLADAAEQMICDIHRRFLEAGADIIETNTFGATSITQSEFFVDDPREHGGRKDPEFYQKSSTTSFSSDLAWEINEQSARQCREWADRVANATGRQRFVAGAIGPLTVSLVELAGCRRCGFPRGDVRPGEDGVRAAGAGADCGRRRICCWWRRSSTR
jgi:hypothetical protein